jgi:integrase
MPGRLSETDEERHVFTYKGKPVHDIRAGIRLACKLAGIDYGRVVRGGFTLHDLRHTFTTRASRAGVPEKVIMAITGHNSRSTFDRYRKVDEGDLRGAVEMISQKINQQEKENPAEAGSLDATT